MSVPTKQKRVDELIEGANASLGRGAMFEAERMAMKALALAHQVEDYQRMAVAVSPILEARRARRELALQKNGVVIVQEAVTEQSSFEVGCYLIQPPLVGADARRLRMAALQSEIPVLVVCREPLTKLGLCPIVAIGPGSTVRTKIDPPKDPDQPGMDWFTGAMEALGDEAIAGIESDTEIGRRIKQILERLDTVPDHDGLHALLEQTCREAAAATTAKARGKRKAKV